MGSLDKLETSLDEMFDKKAPVKIPADGRKGLAHALWWIALVVGLLQLWSAITLWQWGHATDNLINAVNYYTGGVYVRHLGMFYYLSLLSMATVAVLMLLASPQLKAMKKGGWDLLFYGVIVEAVAAVLQLFTSGAGFVNFFASAVGTVIGAFLLFQVREHFIMSHPADHKAAETKKPKE
ncbi:MAG TPA: hypothetical protein VLH86_06195 [Patescibacteria group bacterium]|nr:hypothetical protein [Patescibacteria group bacterium]